MKQIPVGSKYVAFVDDEDYEVLAASRWWPHQCVKRPGRRQIYAVREVWERGVCRKERMHRVIMGAEAGVQVDHRNHDGLDNRRENLRMATGTQNQANRRKQAAQATSVFKGVHRHAGGWRARIKVEGKYRHLGSFKDEIAAARAYDRAAVQLYGEFAHCNEYPS